MIHIIENHSTTPAEPLIDGMYVDRKRLFVDLFGWDVPIVDGRLEMDQFDTGDAVYIIVASPDGEHEASMRLMRSSQPHMLGATFPQLCPGGVPVGKDTWESSRLCLPQRHGAARRRELRNILISAMVDFALARGIARITGIIPEGFRKEVLSMGWLAEPLGPAVPMAGGAVGAFAIHIGPDTPARLRWTNIYVSTESCDDAVGALKCAIGTDCPEKVA